MSLRSRFITVAAAFVFLAATQLFAATRIIYVKAGAASAGANGQSWATAYPQLWQAIEDARFNGATAANPVDIWITSGTFTPDIFSTSGDLISAAAFDLRSWVRIRGGFNASAPEASLDARSPSNPHTVLSGDIEGVYHTLTVPTSRGAAASAALPDPANASFADNCRNVIRCVNTVGSEIERCVITGGYARNDTSYPDGEIERMGLPDPTNLDTSGAKRALVPNVSGGGIYVENTAASTGAANLVLTDCIVTQNYARGVGAGIAVVRSKVIVNSTIFAANLAVREGGAYFGRDHAVSFTDCDFIRNRSSLSGGAVFLESPVRVPTDWKLSPKSFLLASSETEYQNIVGNAITVARLGWAFNKDRVSELAPSIFSAGLDSLNGTGSSGTPTLGRKIANRVEGPAGYVTAVIEVLGTGSALARQYGANDDFTKFMVDDFMPNYNKYATPTGLATVIAGLILEAQGRDHPETFEVKDTYTSLYNRALAQTFTACRFTSNYAAYDGSAIEAVRDNVTIDRCLFSENNAGHDATVGIHAFNTMRVFNSVFSANTADGTSAILTNIFTRARIINSTLVNNAAASLGGYAVGVGTGGECRVINSILWGNTNAAAENTTGGADIFTSRYANLDDAMRQQYNDSKGTEFTYVGLTEIANSDVQGLSRLVNNWGVSNVKLFTEHRSYTDGEIAGRLLFRANAEEESAHDEWDMIVVGEGDRIADRGNFSVDPQLHDSYFPSLGSPILTGGSLKRYNTIYSAPGFVDFAGQDRWFRNEIGLGAFANPSLPTGTGAEAPGRYFVRPTATGDGTGRNWANATADLKTTLALANAEVWVAAGTYYPSSTGDRTASFSLGAGTRAYGGFAATESALNERDYAANVTILSGNLAAISGGAQPSYHVVKHTSVTSTSVLDGFTITGGRADGSVNTDTARGAGIFHDNSQVVLRNLIVSNHAATSDGGGFYSRGGVTSNVDNCQFLSNTANKGAAIYTEGAIDIDRSQFRDNEAVQYGGAVALIRASNVTPVTDVANYLPAVVSNSVFYNNRLTGGAGQGGALYARYWNLRILNSTLYGNRAVENAGAGYFGQAVHVEDIVFDLQNSILRGNRAPGSTATFALERSQFLAPYEVARDVVTLRNNNIEGFNSTNAYSGFRSSTLVSGNFDADPHFLNTATGDLHVASNSPVIDRGTGSVDLDRSADADGFVRRIGGAIDVGAYEFQGASQSTLGLVTRTRSASDDGLVYTFKFLPDIALGGAVTYTWSVNRNDGRGFVALTSDSHISGLGTDTLVVSFPPTSWSEWQFRMEASGTRSSVATGVMPKTTGKERLYVKADATGANDGTSWSNAFTRIEDAIAAAGNDYTQIWVAQGTYRPSAYKLATATYHLRPGLVLYGGFNGTETAQSQRDPSRYPTVLTGDYSSLPSSGGEYLDANNLITYSWDTSVTLDTTLPGTIDGFTLRTARQALFNISDNARPTISRCILENDFGSGAFIFSGTPKFKHTILRKIKERAVRVLGGTPVFEFTQFLQNEGADGAALLVDAGTVTLTNCTIADNFSTANAGGIYVTGGTVNLSASILWNNRDFATESGGSIELAQLNKRAGTITIANSLVEKLSAYAGSGNLGTHPLWVDPANLNYALMAQSPANVLSAGAIPFLGTTLAPLGITELPLSRTELTSVFSATFTVGWNGTFTQTVSWQIDKGQGWVAAASAGFTTSVSTTTSSSSLVVSSGNTLPTLRVRAVTSGGVALPVTQLTVIPPLIRYVNHAAAAGGNGLTWATAWRDPAVALSNSLPGTEIWIARGTYNIPSGLQPRPGVAFVGGFVGTETNRSQRVLNVANTTTLATTLIVISHATAVYQDGNTYSHLFGRHLVLDGLTITPDNTTYTGPILDVRYGAGIYRNTTFTNPNSAGGAGPAVKMSNASPRFENCSFINSPGSGIKVDGGSPRFDACLFDNNGSTSAGAGIAISGGGSAFIDRCTFSRNTSPDDGGAIFFFGSTLTVANTIFSGNTARNGSGLAAGNGHVTLRNCTFADNRARQYGAGVYTYGAAVDIANSIFWRNTGIASALTHFDGSLVEAHQLRATFGGALTVANSIVQGLSAFTGNSNLAYDPLFLGSVGAPYALTAASPALSQGNLAALESVAPVATNPGRVNGTLDLGAVEFSGAAGTPIQLTSTPTSVTLYNSANHTFTVTGGAGIGTDVAWERFVSGNWVAASGADIATASTSTSATLTLSNVQPSSGAAYRFRLPSQGYTSPSFVVTVVTRATVYVNSTVASSGNGSSWATAFKTIEAAVASSSSPLEIRIAAGTYTPPTALALKQSHLFLGGYPADGSITAPSQRNPATHIVNIVGTSGLVRADGSTGTIDTSAGFDGVKFTVSGNTGLYITKGAEPLFRNCTFQNASATATAIEADLQSAPEFIDCTFADSIGPVLKVTIGASAHIAGGTFVRNEGTVLRAEFRGSFVVESSTFDRNPLTRLHTTGWPQLISIASEVTSSIAGCKFTNNGNGGTHADRKLVSLLIGTLTVTDSLFADNAAEPLYTQGFLTGTHLTVVNNATPARGTAGVRTAHGTADLRNSIFWNNRSVGGSPWDIQGQQLNGHIGLWSSIVEGLSSLAGSNNSGSHPLFVDASAANYALSAHSPAINTGAVANSSAVDLVGTLRSGTPDRGAYEFTGTPEIAVQLTHIPYTPELAKTSVRNTGTFVVAGAAGTGAKIQWWSWNGTNLVSLPTDGRFTVTTTSTESTLKVTNVALTDTLPIVFTVTGSTYKSPLFLLRPTLRPRVYVDPASTHALGGDGASWATAYRSLAYAVEAAPVGAEIWVKAGSYGGWPALPLRTGIELYGGFTTHATDISQRSADASLTVLRAGVDATAAVDSTAVVDGFTFAATGIAIDNDGGSPAFRNCVFRDNITTLYSRSGNPTFASCVFGPNTTQISLADGTVTVTGGEITGASQNGIRVSGGTLFLSGVDAHDVTGYSFASATGGQITIDRSRFRRLSHVHVFQPTSFSRYDSSGGTITLRNSLVQDCTASDGAVFDVWHGQGNIIHTTFFNNRGGYSIGGAAVSTDGTLTIRNSILWRNRAARSPGSVEAQQLGVYPGDTGTASISHSVVEGLTNFAGNNNLGYDPLFADVLTGNLALTAASPAVNAGDATLSQSGFSLDYAGNARVFGAAPDLGAHELGAAADTPLNVVRSPVSATLGAAGTAQFIVEAASGGGEQFTWEIETSPGVFGALPSDGLHHVVVSGNVSTLSVGPVTTAFDGKRYRFRIGSSTTGSAPLSLTVVDRRVLYVNSGATGSPVDGSTWDRAYRNIGDAVTAWTVGAEIWVTASTFYVNSYYTQAATVTLQPGMKIYGGFTGAETSPADRSGFSFTGLTASGNFTQFFHAPAGLGRDTIVDGFTFANVGTNRAFTVTSSSPTIANCSLLDFTAPNVIANTGSAPLIKNCKFYAAPEGAILEDTSSSEIVDCHFYSNQRTGAGNVGSAILMRGNRAGGEITTVRNGYFYGNIGGAIRVINGSNALLDACYFTQNTGTESAVLYAASGTTVELRHTLVAKNTTTATRGVVSSDGALTLRHVTFADNTIATWSNHTGALESAGSLAIYNSILWGNRATGALSSVTAEQHQLYAHGSAPVIDHTIVEGLSVYAGNNNLAYNPFFDSRPSYAYQLTRTSPAINAGSNANAQLPATDLANGNRLVGANVDLGAFELADIAGAVAMSLANNPSDETSQEVTIWTTRGNSISIAGDAATVAKIYWEVFVEGAWTALPSGGDLTASFNSSAATLAIAAPATETIADRQVRFRVTGTDYVSSVYTVTTRTRVLHVNPDLVASGDGLSWATAFHNLESALAAATPFTEIWLKRGQHGGSSALFTFKPGLRIYGGFAGTEADRSGRAATATTEIFGRFAMNDTDASNLWHALEFETTGDGLVMTNSSGLFQNCTFTFGNAPTAVTIRNSSQSVVFEDCLFRNRLLALDHSGGSLTLRRCTFTFNDHSLVAAGDVLIEDSTFSADSPQDGTREDSLRLSGTSLRVRRSKFLTLDDTNTPVRLINISGTAEFTDCSFVGNRGFDTYAAALHAENVATLELDRCIFRDNTAINSGASALSASGGAVSIRNTYFGENDTNSTLGNVGAVHLTDCASTLVGVTLIRNSGVQDRNGLVLDGAVSASNTATIVNSVFWGNHGATTIPIEPRQLSVTNTALTLHHSLIMGLDALASAGVGMLAYAPREALNATHSLYIPTGDSPLRHVGDSSVVLTGETDVLGNPRLAGVGVDLGAFELTSAESAPVYDLAQSRTAPGAFLEVSFDTTGQFFSSSALEWQINTGSGWSNVSAAQLYESTTSGALRILRLKWLPASLQGARVRLHSNTHNSPELTLDFGAVSTTDGNVLAITPTPDSRASSTRPAISASFSHALAANTLSASSFVVHGSQRGRLAGAKWGTIASDLTSATLTLPASFNFAAGETVEVTASRSLATALGGTFAPYVSRFSIPWSSRPGAFRQGSAFTASGTITGIAAGDLNADGKTDVMLAGADSAWIYLGDGFGAFTRLNVDMAGAWTAFAIADFNGDGRNDFAGSRAGSNLFVNTVRADATGTDAVVGSLQYAGTRLLPGDFNGDGHQDLLVLGESTSPGELLLLNTGSGGFAPAGTQRFNVTERTREAAVADLDHDGDLDFVQVGATTGDIVVWLNHGGGAFTTGATIRIPNTQTIALADIDRDGWTDLVVAGGAGVDTLHIWRNDRTGRLVPIRSLQAGAIVQLAAADYDGDGDNDVLALSGSAPDQFWRNDGFGGFTMTAQTWTSTGANATAQLAIADLNNDGAPDIALPQGPRPIFWTPGIWFAGFAATVTEGGVKTFAATDFTSATTANTGFTLTGYRVASLPANGALKKGGVAVTVNQTLTLSELSLLTYTPTHTSTVQFYGTDAFSLAPLDSAGASPAGRVVINVTRIVDSPVAEAQTYTAFSGISGNITLGASHPEDEAVTLSILSLPTHGTLQATGTAGVYRYTSTSGYVGADSFVFRVTDAFGGSATATVTIDVTSNTRTVTTVADSGEGSLRAQFAFIAANPGAWRIVFDASLAGQTISLAAAGDTAVGPSAFLIDREIQIDGAAAPGLVLKRAASTAELRLFRVTNQGNLTLRHLILEGGYVRGATAGVPARGAAIYNEGGLETTNVVFRQHHAHGVGTAGAEGGAIYTTFSSTRQLVTSGTSFISNQATDEAGNGRGGAIFTAGAPMEHTSAAFTTNVAPTSGADVHVHATGSQTRSTWNTTTVQGFGATSDASSPLTIVSRGSSLPATIGAWVAPISPLVVTAPGQTVSLTVAPADATVDTGYFGSVSANVGLNTLTGTGATRTLVLKPLEGASTSALLAVSARSGWVTYYEQVPTTYSVGATAAPTATNQTINVFNGAATAVVLNATHAASLTATYSITNSPAKGALTGTAPNLTYTPFAGAVGIDEFAYRIIDSRGRIAQARVFIQHVATSSIVTNVGHFDAGIDAASATTSPVVLTIGSVLENATFYAYDSHSTPYGPAAYVITGDLTIDATAVNTFVLERSGAARRLFYIAPGGKLTLKNVTVKGGEAIGAAGASGAAGGPGLGGAILNAGTLVVQNGAFESNNARGGDGTPGGLAHGAALYNLGGAVTVSGALFRNNFVYGGSGATPGAAEGGALFSRNGTVSLTSPTFYYGQAHTFSHIGLLGDGGLATFNATSATLTSISATRINGGAVTINAGASAITSAGLASLAPVSQFTISGVATIPLPLANGPLDALAVTSLDPSIVPNSWLSTPGTLAAPSVKITTVSPAINATTSLRVSGTKDGITFTRDVPVKLAAYVAPVAQAQAVTVMVNVAKTFTLAATVPAGVTPAFAVTAPPQHGTLSGTAPDLTYTPNNAYIGADTLTFRVTDDTGTQSSAVVTFDVKATGVPFWHSNNFTYIVARNTATALSPPVGHTAPNYLELPHMVYSIPEGGAPAHGAYTLDRVDYGSGTVLPLFTYTPNPGFLGADSFTIKVVDRNEQTATETFNIVVMDPAANTRPALAGVSTSTPIPGSTTTPLQAFAAATVTDPEAPPQSVTVYLPVLDAAVGEWLGATQTDQHGWWEMSDGSEVVGVDSDGNDIYRPINPRLMTWGTPAEVTAKLRGVSFRLNRVLSPGQSENVAIRVTLDDDFTWEDPRHYDLTFRFTAPAQPPVASALSVTTLLNTSAVFTLPASHPQSLALTYTIPTAPGKGTLTGTAPNLTYTPNNGAFGADSFVYRVTDATGNFASATVSVFINRRPVALADTLSRPSGQIAKISVASLLANDTDPDGDALTFVSAAGTSAQNVALTVSEGWIFYPAPPSLAVNDSFTYTVRDARNATTTGTVNIIVEVPPPITRMVLSIAPRTGGGVTLRLAGVAGRSYTVQVSTDLVTWTALSTATADNLGLYVVDDPTAPADGAGRFYRAIKTN